MNRSTAAQRIARVIVIIVAVFFAASAAFALAVAATVLVPGTPLDGLWAMKPGSRAGFIALGGWAIALLALLALVLVLTSIGLFRRRPLARWVAFALLAINVIPDAVQGFAGDVAIFVPIVPVAAIAVFFALPVMGRAFRARAAAAVGADGTVIDGSGAAPVGPGTAEN